MCEYTGDKEKHTFIVMVILSSIDCIDVNDVEELTQKDPDSLSEIVQIHATIEEFDHEHH